MACGHDIASRAVRATNASRSSASVGFDAGPRAADFGLADVRFAGDRPAGAFPDAEHSYSMDEAELDRFEQLSEPAP